MTRPIDIIIVNFNTRDELAKCLTSLHDARPASVERVVVVDNASGDESVATVRARWPAVSVIALDRNHGFGAANNIALRESQAEFVLFLNSDTVAPPGAVDALLERLRARGVVAAGPRLVDAQGRPEVSFGPMLTPMSELVQRVRTRIAARQGWLARRYVARLVSGERIVDWVTGACLLARRESVVAAGGFDERFFLYEEDVDLCASLRARGGTILFTPRATVVHLGGKSVGRSRAAANRPSQYDASHIAFYEKHAPRWAPWLRRWLRLRGRTIG